MGMNIIHLHVFNIIRQQLAQLKNPSVSLLWLPLVLNLQISADETSSVHISCRVNPHYSCISLHKETAYSQHQRESNFFSMKILTWP